MTKEIVKKEAKEPNAIQRYFHETVGELRKVSWPTREEATQLTTIVVIVVLALSSFLAIFDVLFSRFFALILGAE